MEEQREQRMLFRYFKHGIHFGMDMPASLNPFTRKSLYQSGLCLTASHPASISVWLDFSDAGMVLLAVFVFYYSNILKSTSYTSYFIWFLWT